MADWSGWVQAGVATLIATTGATFLAGSHDSSLASTKAQVAAMATQQQTDHDKVIAMDSKVDDVRADVAEIKQDVKSLLRK